MILRSHIIESAALALGIGIMLAFGGCASFDGDWRGWVNDWGETYEQIEADKEAARKAEAEREAEEERKAEEDAKAKAMPPKLVEGAPYRIYKDGPDWVFAYRGGAGLYKPESRLWLVGGVKASEVLTAGEYDATGSVVRWLRIGGNEGPRGDGNQVIVESGDMYHSGQLKLRDAKVLTSGNTLILICRDGRRFEKRIIDRDWRQE